MSLVPAWTAPRRSARPDEDKSGTPMTTEIEEARQRAARMSTRLTQGHRKSTIGLEYADRFDAQPFFFCPFSRSLTKG